jgi:hypothetical protein
MWYECYSKKIVTALSLKVENAAKKENLVLGCETNIYHGNFDVPPYQQHMSV